MNLLVTGAWAGAKENMDRLKMMGHEVIFLQQEKDELPCDYSWVEGVVCNGLFLSHPIEKFKNLRYVQLTSAGFDRVPMEYVKEHKIEIRNARGVYSIPMAEYAIAGVLQLYKQFPTFNENQRKHEWNKIRTLQEINNSTVCIIGCGSVGTECAKRFNAFGAKVIGVDLYPRVDNNYHYMIGVNELDEALSDSNIIVLTVPFTEETNKLMNRERISLLKQGAVLVNMARGGVMDYDAFITLKQEGKDILAVLDVFEQEPLDKRSPLWDMEGVIITPHNSFVGNGNRNRLDTLIIRNLEK